MNTQLPQLESPESSSPIITRAVAAGLRGEYCDSYIFPAWQRSLLGLLGRLPPSAARFAISRFQTLSGLDPARLDRFSINDLIRERLQDYASLQGPFPAIVMGAGLGGASAHLSLALGAPFLPQAFVTTLRGGSPDGCTLRYYERSASRAMRIAAQNRQLITIQHFDPVHDGWLTRFVNHLRFKLIDLPEAYKDYIHSHLAPGGAVCFLDCRAQWLRFRVAERSFFQVGGWGDLSPQEFIDGSSRLQEYCRQAKLSECGWRLEGFPLESGPESEWGVEPGLGEALKAFCEAHGYRFVRIALPEPHDYSRLAYLATLKRLEKEGRRPSGILVEMFSQYDATAVERAGLLPLWLIFNTWDSLRFLQQMRSSFPADRPVFFSPLSTFTLTPDMVPWKAWEQVLEGLDWTNIGTRPSHYPSDALALVSWAQPLRSWIEKNAAPLQCHLLAEELQEIAAELQPAHKRLSNECRE